MRESLSGKVRRGVGSRKNNAPNLDASPHAVQPQDSSAVVLPLVSGHEMIPRGERIFHIGESLMA